jgi:Histidine phosphatase superfamily (branch 1)
VKREAGSRFRCTPNRHYVAPLSVNNIRGYLPLKVVHFVMNLHTLPRTFFLTRHGQSEYNLLGKIGGDSGLTAAGKEYARRLAEFAKDVIATEKVGVDPESGEDVTRPRPARLWTSTLRRTQETAQFIEHDVRERGCHILRETTCIFF